MLQDRPDVRERLESEIVIWLTTVDPRGQPQSSPVWFLAREDEVVLYSLAGTPRTRNIRANPRVCLHLNSTPGGGRLVILEGRAEIAVDPIPAHQDEAFMAKYEPRMPEDGLTPATFSRDYPVRIVVRATRLRTS